MVSITVDKIKLDKKPAFITTLSWKKNCPAKKGNVLHILEADGNEISTNSHLHIFAKVIWMSIRSNHLLYNKPSLLKPGAFNYLLYIISNSF